MSFRVLQGELRHVKYLHIFWHNDVKFNVPFARMICTEDKYFNSGEHIFVTPHSQVYEKIKEYGNACLVEDGNLINACGKYCDWIFVHCLGCNKLSFLFTKKKYARKVIWRTWGHDVKTKADVKSQLSLKRKFYCVIKNAYVTLHANIIRRFYMIGIANSIDILKINKVYGDMKTNCISYGYRPEHYVTLKSTYEGMKPSEVTRVLVGHSGWDSDKHFEIFEKLKEYANENILVTMVLSYGDKDYIKLVKEKAIEYFGDKVEFIEEFMPNSEYAKFLSGIDIAILASVNSSALGNLALLTFFEKKVYVNPNGDLAVAIENDGCKYYDYNDIGNISFKDFIKIDVDNLQKMKSVYGNIRSPQESCQIFSKLLKDLIR